MRWLAAMAILAGCDVIWRIDPIEEPPPIVGRWAQVAGGDGHTCALDDDGFLWCWGRNSNGEVGIGATTPQLEAVQQIGDNTWRTVDTSTATTCAIDGGGALFCWGENFYGQVGDGTTADVNAPKQIGTELWHAVSVGDEHTCAIKEDRSLWCWGRGDTGALGNGTTTTMQPSPTLAAAAGPWEHVAASYSSTCAIASDQTRWCWGANESGQLGNGMAVSGLQTTPVQVGTDAWRELTGGDRYACGITTTGRLRCWGYNVYGVLGDGSETARSTPASVLVDGTDKETWEHVAAGDDHTCAIETGRMWCWGTSSRGQLGLDGTYLTPSPIEVIAEHDWIALGTGTGHTCGIAEDHSMYCFGADGSGQLGDGGTSLTTPARIAGQWQSASGGDFHACAIDTQGVAHCTGDNRSGNLGVGTRESYAALTPLAGNGWTSISAGYRHTCGILGPDVLCWGADFRSQLGNGDAGGVLAPTRIASGRAVAVNDHSCAIDNSDILSCWGPNSYGQVGNGTVTLAQSTPAAVGGSFYKAVGTGVGHTCAIATGTDGVACWGWNIYGQLGDGGMTSRSTPAGLQPPASAAQIAVGGFHACLVRADKTAACWGNNGYGQLGLGDTSHRRSPAALPGTWRMLSIGYFHSCGIRDNDGTLSCWGRNQRGQLGDGTRVDRRAPTPVGGDNDWATVAAGYAHTCATKIDASLWCWGDNEYGALGNGAAWRAELVRVP